MEELFIDHRRSRALKVTSAKEIFRIMVSAGLPELMDVVERQWLGNDMHRDVRATVLQCCLKQAVEVGDVCECQCQCVRVSVSVGVSESVSGRVSV